MVYIFDIEKSYINHWKTLNLINLWTRNTCKTRLTDEEGKVLRNNMEIGFHKNT